MLRACVCFLLLCLAGTAQALSYDVSRSTRYVLYAYAAYVGPNTPYLSSWSCSYCKNQTVGMKVTKEIYYHKREAFVYLGVNPVHGEIVVSYRGTIGDLRDWLNNLEFWKADKPFDGIAGAKVASGWLATYQSVQPQVIAELKSLMSQYPSYPVVFTGHSQGAALAVLNVADVLATGLMSASRAILWSFGTPRVGDKTFANAVNGMLAGNSFHVVNHHDIVPHLPPQLLAFHHSATEVWYSQVPVWPNQGAYLVCDGSGEDSRCSDSVHVWQYSVADHLTYMGIQCCMPYPNATRLSVTHF